MSLGDILRTVRQWVDSAKPVDGQHTQIEQTPAGRQVNVLLPPIPAVFPALVRITAGPDGDGFYTADVYGDGPANDATATGQKARLFWFEVDSSDVQGYYLGWPYQEDVSGALALVHYVFPPFRPPTNGTYYLRASDQQVAWIAAGDCTTGAGSEEAEPSTDPWF